MNRTIVAFICLSVLSFWVGCSDKFEAGKASLSKGDKTAALALFEGVESSDNNYALAQRYVRTLRDEIRTEQGDSCYQAQDFDGARSLYSKISTLSNEIGLRVRVCDTLSKFFKLTDSNKKYVWLKSAFSSFNKKMYNKYILPSDYWLGLREYYLEALEHVEHQDGFYGEMTCYPWGSEQSPCWHTGYAWKDSWFTIQTRYQGYLPEGVDLFAGGPGYRFTVTIEPVLHSRVEIPNRALQIFFVRYSKIKGSEKNFFEVVATLGHNGKGRNLVWTTDKLADCFEDVLTRSRGNQNAMSKLQ